MWKKLILLSAVLVLALGLSVSAGTYPGHLGVNIGLPARGGTFTDQVKGNYRYETTSGQPLGSGDVDSQGWPTRDCQYIVDWRPVAEWSGSIDDPEQYRVDMSGTYKCAITGQATLTHIEGDFAIQNQVYDSGTNTTTFDIVVDPPGPQHGVMVLQFTNTKRTAGSPTNTGFTNFKMMRPGYTLDTTQIFTDDLINCLTSADFSAIRFMDFRQTNDSEPSYPATTSWSQRKLTTDASQASMDTIGKLDGGAWEYVIDIGNLANMDIWINVQISADTDYVTQLATLIKNNLNPGLNVYVESSNETWNSIFGQQGYNHAQANALGLTDQQNHARRTVELAQIFESVFGAGSLNNRVRVMLCWHQPMRKWDVEPMLQWINDTYGPPSNYIYAVACQTYFGGDAAYGGGKYRKYNVQQLLQAAHDSITEQITDTGSDEAGRTQWIAMAANWNLPGGFCSYEGGPDYGGGGTGNLDNRILCNRDPGMATEFKYNLDDAFCALGANLAMQYSLTSSYDRYGCWGLTDDVANPDRNYKFQAARDLLGVSGPPGQASNPSPADGATGVSTTATLSWTAGSGATSHDVYFGTVSNPPFVQNQTQATYDPGTMAQSTTYYWKIDEVNSYGTTTGLIWSFTTGGGGSPPGQASNPSPADGATGVSTTATLSWTAGSGATSHDVYFGTVSNPPFVQNQTQTTYDPGTMAEVTTYYWRIDEVNSYGTTTGVLWSFTTGSGGGCTPSTMHVDSIVVTSFGIGQGKSKGRAEVTIVDNCGNPVSGALVSGTFSGDINESRSGTTDGSGLAVIETSIGVRALKNLTFCVDDVTDTLTYNSADNVETCDFIWN